MNFFSDTVLTSIADDIGDDMKSLGWFLLPDLVALLISGYYIFTIKTQWNKSNVDEIMVLNV